MGSLDFFNRNDALVNDRRPRYAIVPVDINFVCSRMDWNYYRACEWIILVGCRAWLTMSHSDTDNASIYIKASKNVSARRCIKY